MGLPPLLAGALNARVSVPLALGVIEVIVGASGVVNGVASIELLVSPAP